MLTAPPTTVQVNAPDPNTAQQIPVQNPSQQQQPPQIPQQPVAMMPVTPQAIHSASLGHGFKSLMQAMEGSHTEYQQTPNGPVSTQVRNKPGQLFRSILAGAILGGANGGDSGSGWQAAASGARAVDQRDLYTDQVARQQAQQRYENNLRAKQEQRDEQGFNTEEQLRKAQIANANAETLRTNTLTQGASFDLHQEQVKADQNRISTYSDAGIKPIFDNIPESEMTDILKNHPGASAYDWRHTGVVTVPGPDGIPHYEYTLSAYDPKGTAPLSDATVKQWADDGLFKYHPEYKDAIKAGKPLTVGQFEQLDSQAQKYATQDLAKQKDQLGIQEIQAHVDEAHAAIKAHMATVAHENAETHTVRATQAKQEALDTAWQHMAAAGNDPNKAPMTAEDRMVIAESAKGTMDNILSAIKDNMSEVQMGDADAKQREAGLWGTYNTLSRLASLGGATGPNQQNTTINDPVGRALQTIQGMNPDDAINAIDSSSVLTPEQKSQARLQFKQQQDRSAAQTRGNLKQGVQTVLQNPGLLTGVL